MNALSIFWSKNPPPGEVGDHAAFSDPVECISGSAFNRVVKSVRACRTPVYSEPVWVTGLCFYVAGSATLAPRTGVKAAADAWIRRSVHAKGLLNVLVYRIKGSGPELALCVCDNRSAERSLAYEG